jgi:hypothetical protein
MEFETGTNYHPVRVSLPLDGEEQRARNFGINYTQIRSGKVKIFTPEEIEEFARSYLS